MKRHSARLRLVVLAMPALMAVSAGCDIAFADFKEKQTSEWRKTYDLPPGGTLELSNVNGSIDVRPSTGNTVEVVAEKIAKAASQEMARQALERIEIQETVSPSAIRIETRLQRNGGLFNRAGSVEVRYTVRVPTGADVKFSAVNGGIVLAGLSGRIALEATNGGIKASDVGGSIRAETTNGGVEVNLSQVPEDGVKLGCTNGGIKLSLPSTAKATFEARITNGGIDVNGLELETTESSRRRLDGRLNGGGPRIELSGTNGGIRIAAR